MAIILNIETATKNCSVSISDNDKILNCIELNEGQFSHAEKLHHFILEVLEQSQLHMKNIEAVAVSKGPGSYTGLRIGVSAAKGLCYALEVPLISVPTLSSLAHSLEIKKGEYIIPLIDARRMEVYSAVFNDNYEQIRETKAEIIEGNSFSVFLKKGKVHFLGDGATKCKEIIQHDNAFFADNLFPSANEMANLSYKKFISNDFEDVAYFEPYYLKDFIAGKPKKYFN